MQEIGLVPPVRDSTVGRYFKMILETSRTVLREFVNADASSLSCLLSDPRSMEYAPMPPTSELTVAERLIAWHQASYSAHRHGAWAVIEKGTGAFIGQAGLLKHERWVELFFSFMPHAWGRGLATETALACRDYAFTRLDLPRVVGIIHPENRRAIAVAKRVGMEHTGTFSMWGRDNVLYEAKRL